MLKYFGKAHKKSFLDYFFRVFSHSSIFQIFFGSSAGGAFSNSIYNINMVPSLSNPRSGGPWSAVGNER